MLGLDQERHIGTVEDSEGGRGGVKQGQGVVRDRCSCHCGRWVDVVEVDTDQLEQESEKDEERISSLPDHLQGVEGGLQDLYCFQCGHHFAQILALLMSLVCF